MREHDDWSKNDWTENKTLFAIRVIYFIEGEKTKLIKIGKTAVVAPRLRYLQTGSPDKLKVLGVIKTESDDHVYHRKLAADWVWGEWFRPSNSLMDFILQIPPSTDCGLSVVIGNLSVAGAAQFTTRARARAKRKARNAGRPRRDCLGRPAKVVDLKAVCARLKRQESLRSVARSIGLSHSTLREHLQRSGLLGGLDY